ncbi:MAG TPA: hypothetical protein VHH14_02045, partial [Solirubrobacterales bacterium]|nr:hypothetical protein [Solirubrobacterales bacterium]
FAPEELDEVVFSRSLPKGSRYWQEGSGRRPLSAEEKAALYEFFAEDVDRLEAMLGRDLSAWRHA